MRRTVVGPMVLVCAVMAGGCREQNAGARARASGYVEATEVRAASKVAGRLEQVRATEGARVTQGDVLATLSTVDIDGALRRAWAERAQADAQVKLLAAPAHPEDLAQAEAQIAAAIADRQAAESELAAATTDAARFEQLLQNRAGSEKQRDEAVARRNVASARAKAAADRVAAATAVRQRLRAGARTEELEAARARVAVVEAGIGTLEQDRRETTIVAPASGVVTSRLAEPGELVPQGGAVAVIVDIDRAWVNAYVEEPLVPTLRLDQPVTIVTDAASRLPGRITFIAPRAEFTPRNVQTSSERAKLVYRVKVTTDNREGILKPGMPVEVELGQ